MREDEHKIIEEGLQRIRDFIDEIPDPERRLRAQQYQWQIEGELRKYKDPVARMNHMIEIFWAGVYEFNDALKQFREPEENEERE